MGRTNIGGPIAQAKGFQTLAGNPRVPQLQDQYVWKLDLASILCVLTPHPSTPPRSCCSAQGFLRRQADMEMVLWTFDHNCPKIMFLIAHALVTEEQSSPHTGICY